MEPDNKSSAELDRLMSETEKRLLSSFLDSFAQNLQNSAKLKGRRLKVVIEEEEGGSIPTSIFSKELGVLETAVKYLHESQGRSLGEVASILKRTPNNIAVTYLKAKSKHPGQFRKSASKNSVLIPLSIFSARLTCFESICIHMKDTLGLQFSRIGELLGRDEKTIWTIYTRAKKKVKNG